MAEKLQSIASAINVQTGIYQIPWKFQSSILKKKK